MPSSVFTALPLLPLALGGIGAAQTQVNAALMVGCTGWTAWAILVLWGTDSSTATRGQRWLAAFLAMKGLAPSLGFALAQATDWDREFIQATFYLGTSALAYAGWGKFMMERWPAAAAARWLCWWGWAGLLGWLAIMAVRGPADAWRAWPWLAVVPVVAGALWAGRQEHRLSFAAIAAAALMEFADPHTVLSWYAGFVHELSLSWAELADLPATAVRPAAGNGFLVVPVTNAARIWFASGMVAAWVGFLGWNAGEGRRRGFWLLPAAALALTAAAFTIYGVSVGVAFRALSRENFSRLKTLATVAPRGDTPAPAATAQWRTLRQIESDLGQIFRFRVQPDGQRVLLDPVPGRGRLGLPVLPLERLTLARREAYGVGPIMDLRGAAFYAAVPMAGSATDWLGVIAPIERFYAYKRPTALLGNMLISLFGIVGVAALGYLLQRERDLRQQLVRERAEEATRMKTTFLAKVSHELRTPLQSLLGYGELLQRDAKDDATRARVAALRQHGELMIRLVNDLIDLSAIEVGAFRLVENPLRLDLLVQQTVENLRPQAAAKSLDLRCVIDPHLPPWIAADAGRTRQIVLNLVGNALKFTTHGRVEVAVTLLSRTGDRCIVELAVTDTGPGIPSADQPRLFQMFSRLDPATSHEGSGLGLALSAALCRSAGGSLTVESDGRSGSCFRARLDASIASEPPLAPAAQPFASLQGKRVLVVDDNALVRDLFAACLTELGASCELAVDGRDALARAEATSFDAVVLDLAMPHLDGLTLTRHWRAQGRMWRIVGVSAHAAPRDHAEALAAGMNAFLTKPVELAALVAALVAESGPMPESRGVTRVRGELIERFRAEAAAQGRAVQDALLRRDWSALRASAHYLKSSAGVVGDPALYYACGAVEDAADARNPAAANAAWAACETALAPWLRW